VLFEKSSGNDIKVSAKDLLIIKERDNSGVIAR